VSQITTLEKEQRKVTLKVIRAIKGKKQSDISDSLKQMGRNIEQTAVSQWERGVKTPTIEVAIDLAVAYEVSFLELVQALGFEPDRKKRQPEDHAS
jgi:transcriptional regulator with XRE-family HTH domain